MSEESKPRPSYSINHARVVPMLDIRATGRNAIALPYLYLEMVQYNPSVALVLTFSTCEVRIEGHCLSSIYENLVEHAVEFIQENDAKYEQPDKNQPFIRRIEIKPVCQETNLIVVGFDPDREPLDELL
jgi:hypothetical protein